MEHLKFCLKEILIAKELLELKNSSFYKRSIARYLAVRVDDFVKLAFPVNKSTINDQQIKNELNALQELYKNYFKTQRDKFGAHFQKLEFATRLESWKDIDFEKADFFTSQPIDIYKKFSGVSGYIPPNLLISNITDDLRNIIINKNDELDIEKYPHFSSDILTHTRYNTGGLISFSEEKSKAATLKSLELIIDYNIAIYEIVKGNADLENLFKTLIILDVVSYSDNFITRTDLLPRAKQEEDGLDKFITETDYPIAYKILKEFTTIYQFDENLLNIRAVRNIACGHIDISMSIADIINSLQSINVISQYP